jgi:hypothetical protein
MGSLGVAVILLQRDCQIPYYMEAKQRSSRHNCLLDLSIQQSITAILGEPLDGIYRVTHKPGRLDGLLRFMTNDT